MMVVVLIMFGMAALSIVLGFIALIMQKTYIDSDTSRPTEIAIPFLGKMKTNFPALIFVFLGFILAFKAPPLSEVEWVISGSLAVPEGSDIDLSFATSTPAPRGYEFEIAKEGRFEIRAKIPEGTEFEEEFETIRFDHPATAGVMFYPEKELKNDGDGSLLANRTKTTRELKPILLEPWR